MLSIPHLVIIFLIALIVLGPEKLPQVARVLGKAMADFRRITTDFRVQIEDEMREMERHTRLQQTTAGPPSYTPSDAELLGATPATTTPATIEATAADLSAPAPALEPVVAAPEPSTPAPASSPEKPADGKSQPA
jgi:sec-independent protein translocase protein TatB